MLVLQAIVSGDIIPTLCEHAHSSNTKLRIESLWALKHVVYNSANDIKIRVLQALGSEWIHRVISQDPVNALTQRELDEETDHTRGITMGRANSAGEQVDFLNPMDDTDESPEGFKMNDMMPPSKFSLDKFMPGGSAQRRHKLVFHENLKQSTQSRQDDIAVQEQTFDLLRNIICGPGAYEMIDHLIREIGQVELLDALADNLHPRTTIQLPHRHESPNRKLQVPQEILSAVTGVIIHIAAGLTRHRQLLISHHNLLRSLLSHLNHSNREVRVNCVWVIINLTFEDDQSDREACRERASRLRALGVADRLVSLQNDPDLDVKERTKTALHLLNNLNST